MDRDIRDPIDLLDEIEEVLKINATPITWPIGMGKHFIGTYNLISKKMHLYQKDIQKNVQEIQVGSLTDPAVKELLGSTYDDFISELDLIQGAGTSFALDKFLSGELTPVFFGTALSGFGVNDMLDHFVKWAPQPQAREANARSISPLEKQFTGFVFKIQANMDPKHRDRMAFLRICSGNTRKE